MDSGVHYPSLGKGEALMDRSLVEVEAIVRNRICKVCTERTVDGNCGLEQPSTCALFRLFPQVAQAIQSTTSNDIQQYIDAIRQNVCTVCADHAADGSCETRQQVQCALDAYLLLVVDAIEEATGKTFEKQHIGSAGAPIGVRPNPQRQF
jgi:hypothetical protein